jgi:hypothetical protein
MNTLLLLWYTSMVCITKPAIRMPAAAAVTAPRSWRVAGNTGDLCALCDTLVAQLVVTTALALYARTLTLAAFVLVMHRAVHAVRRWQRRCSAPQQCFTLSHSCATAIAVVALYVAFLVWRYDAPTREAWLPRIALCATTYATASLLVDHVVHARMHATHQSRDCLARSRWFRAHRDWHLDWPQHVGVTSWLLDALGW